MEMITIANQTKLVVSTVIDIKQLIQIINAQIHAQVKEIGNYMLKDYIIVFIKTEQVVVISRIIQMLVMVLHKLYLRMILTTTLIVYYNVLTVVNYIMKQVIMVQLVLIMDHVKKQIFIVNLLKIIQNNAYSVVVMNIYIQKIQQIDSAQHMKVNKIHAKI